MNSIATDIKFICKTLREAFCFDKEELASKSLIKLLRMYFGDVRYNALVNFRLAQYFYHKQEFVGNYINKINIKIKRHILSMIFLHPLLSLRYYIGQWEEYKKAVEKLQLLR